MDRTCEDLPPLVSSFVDAFVDFSVGGVFFPNPNPNPNPNPIPPSPRRLVSIGDLHGDLAKASQALSLAGIADPATGRWSGGTSIAVQVGDVLDRGGDELLLLYHLRRLQIEASAAGGALLAILGNHEVMNVAGDFRYATPDGVEEFRRWGSWFRAGIAMKRLCSGLPDPDDPFAGVPKSFPGVQSRYWEGFRARVAALRPAGPVAARFLADLPAVLVVGGSVFVHGGLLMEHVAYGLDRINAETRDWIAGAARRRPPEFLRGRDAVVWLRSFSDGADCDCGHLESVLEMIPEARRMVMGHTIQEEGINGVCGGRAIRVDVGLSRGCGDGAPEVLEIDGDGQARVLTSNPAHDPRRWWRSGGESTEEEEKEGLAWLVSAESSSKQRVEVEA